MSKLRRLFTSALMVMVVLGMSAFADFASASAQAGDLIKMDGLSAVYYLGADGKRYVFPDQNTYFSWYEDFSGVVTISATELQSYPLGDNVTMRPGTNLVKITTDPKVYTVEPNGHLRWLQTEEDAIELYGENWAQKVVDVADSFFTNYTIADPLESGEYPAGQLLQNVDGSSIYYWTGEEFRKFDSEAAFVANGFNFDHVIEVEGMTWEPQGEDITAHERMFEIDFYVEDVDEPGVGTGLSVSLSADTPESQTIPSNATRVEVAKFNFTAAADGAVTVNGLEIKRTGVGDPDHVDSVYIYKGSERLTNGRSISANDNIVSFSTLNYEVPAGTTRTLSVVIDVENNADGNHIFGIESASAISTSATVTGSFPITGNSMSFMSGTDVGTIEVQQSGSNQTLTVGERDVELGRFELDVRDETGHFKSVTFYNDKRDILDNLKLYRGSDLLATAEKSGRYFIFDLDEAYEIDRNDSAIFTLRGDVYDARKDDKARLYIRYATDIEVVGQTYGFGMNVDPVDNLVAPTGDTADINEKALLVDVEAGQVTFSFNGPTASDIARDSRDVVLMDFAISSDRDVDVEDVQITLHDSAAEDELSNLEIVCDNSTMNEWSSLGDISDGSKEFDDSSVWTIIGGETMNCQILVDVERDKTDKSIISVDINIDEWVFRDAETGDLITDDVIPSGDMSGNDMTVTAAELDVDLASSPHSQTWVKGSEIEVNGFNFKASDAGDITLTDITLEGAINVGGAWKVAEQDGVKLRDVLTSVKLYYGNTKVGGPVTVGSTDGKVTFRNLDFTIPAGGTHTLVAKATVSNNAPFEGSGGATENKVRFGVDKITAEHDNRNLASSAINLNNLNVLTHVDIDQTIIGAGELSIALSSDTPRADIVKMGEDDVNLTKVRFSAENEDIVIERLTVESKGTSNSDIGSVKLSYTNSNDVTETKTSVLSGGKASFTGLDIFVEKDRRAHVTVKADLNTISANNDNNVQLSVTDENFRAVGQSSGDSLTSISFDDVDGRIMKLFEAKPTVTFAEDTPSGNFIAGANTQVAKIDVTASGDQITFKPGTVATQTIGNMEVAASDPATTTLPTPDGKGIAVSFDASDTSDDETVNKFISAFDASDAGDYWEITATTTNSVEITAKIGGAWGNSEILPEGTGGITFERGENGSGNELRVELNYSIASGATAANVWLTNDDGDSLCESYVNFSGSSPQVFTCEFTEEELNISEGSTETLTLYVNTTLAGFSESGDSIQAVLRGNDNANINWGIDGEGEYGTGEITFRGNIFGKTLSID